MSSARDNPGTANLICKICNDKKVYKSQMSYKNHMVVFHKEKYKSCKTARKRPQDNNNSETSFDNADSEDSDWKPSTVRTKRISSRSSKKTSRNVYPMLSIMSMKQRYIYAEEKLSKKGIICLQTIVIGQTPSEEESV